MSSALWASATTGIGMIWRNKRIVSQGSDWTLGICTDDEMDIVEA